MPRKRTTGPGVSGRMGRLERPVKAQVPPERRITPTRISRGAGGLAREGRSRAPGPPGAQLPAMARLDGRAPCSYRLDAAVNWLPEALPVGFPHGADGLRFAPARGEGVGLPRGCGVRLAL